jgi:hypothetical protein
MARTSPFSNLKNAYVLNNTSSPRYTPSTHLTVGVVVWRNLLTLDWVSMSLCSKRRFLSHHGLNGA